MSRSDSIPVYSLDNFRKESRQGVFYQVEVFDANRHFKVSYPHRHDFYEILYLARGSGFHIIDNNRYRIEPPCVFFLSPGQAHKLELSQDISGYIFLFTAEFYLLNQHKKGRLLEFPFFFSVDRTNPPLKLVQQDDELFLRGLFQRGNKEINKGEQCSEDLIRSLLDLILLSCDQLYPEENEAIRSAKGHFLVKKFLLLIEENYQKNLRVNDYASMLAVTPNHLTQMVRQTTGKTSLTLLQEKYIVEIKRLLLHTNLTVSEIAGAMNFDDQSYFTKFFKKYTGIAPKEFRSKSMKNT
ncbi:MAG: helix-turn-helix domain-containing protein [Bacteroidales bacterium]|nr:helix-turn-helix domain-containing protein [Bacteroidales bacterium]